MKQKSLFRRAAGTNRLKLLVSTTFISMSFLGAAQAGEVTYQYYRFRPTAPLGEAIQISEFVFSKGGRKLNVNNSVGYGQNFNAEITGGTLDANAGEGSMKVSDGSVHTKWFSGGTAETAQPALTFKFDAPVTIDNYNFATANDFLNRFPGAWVFEGSTDGTTYVPLDTRTGQTPRFNGLYTFQAGFDLPTVATAPAINSISATNSAIIAAGSSTDVSYVAVNATSVILTPGNVDITTTPTFTVTPTATTVYTITATGSDGVVTSRDFEVRVAPTVARNFRYVRFTPLQLRTTGANSIQIAEFEFYTGATKLTGVTATNPGGRNSGDGAPTQIVDGSNTTKWLDFNKQGLIFDFGSAKAFDSYQFITGNDATERDPVRWMLEGSNDQTTWSTLEVVGGQNYPTPVARGAATGKLPLTYAPIVWDSPSGETWDNVSTGFKGSTVFSAGKDVLFDDTATVPVALIAEVVMPRTVGFNTTATGEDAFLLVGDQPVTGYGTIIKNGAGDVNITTANNLTGSVIVNSGKLIAGQPKSVGFPDGASTMILRAGSTFEPRGTQFSQRPLTISSATINVPDAARYLHSGPIMIRDTFTKTGLGTLTLYGLNGSNTTVSNRMIVEQGVVEFGTNIFNTTTFGANRLFATVKTGATLRGTTNNAFSGDPTDLQNLINQFRMEGGTWEHQSSFQYLPAGLVTTAGVAQGRIVLKGGIMTGTGQYEPSRNTSDAAIANTTNEFRSVISTEADALPSRITGTGPLALVTTHVVMDVAEGAAVNDLELSRTVTGNFGIIKEGTGNLMISSANTFAGRRNSYVQRLDNPTNITNYDQTLASVKPYDLPDGLTIRSGTVTVANLAGSATGTGSVRVMSGTTLAGTGIITGLVKAEGSIAPGDIASGSSIGNLTVGSISLSGIYKAEVSGTASDALVVVGDIGISGSLQVSAVGAGITNSSYVIATYTGTRTGTFATSGLPAGYSVVYDDVAKEIRIQGTGTTPTGYAAFIGGTGLTGNDALATADPDNDGFSNLIEFVLGGDPRVASQAGAPTLTLLPSGSYEYVFGRSTDSSYLNPGAEYSTTLTGQWTTVPAANVSVLANGIRAGVDKVTVTLPANLANGGKFFVRLKAVL